MICCFLLCTPLFSRVFRESLKILTLLPIHTFFLLRPPCPLCNLHFPYIFTQAVSVYSQPRLFSQTPLFSGFLCTDVFLFCLFTSWRSINYSHHFVQHGICVHNDKTVYTCIVDCNSGLGMDICLYRGVCCSVQVGSCDWPIYNPQSPAKYSVVMLQRMMLNERIL